MQMCFSQVSHLKSCYVNHSEVCRIAKSDPGSFLMCKYPNQIGSNMHIRDLGWWASCKSAEQTWSHVHIKNQLNFRNRVQSHQIVLFVQIVHSDCTQLTIHNWLKSSFFNVKSLWHSKSSWVGSLATRNYVPSIKLSRSWNSNWAQSWSGSIQPNISFQHSTWAGASRNYPEHSFSWSISTGLNVLAKNRRNWQVSFI